MCAPIKILRALRSPAHNIRGEAALCFFYGVRPLKIYAIAPS